MKSVTYSKKKRRTKPVKTAEQREDELPWEIPSQFDPTFLPTSLYKSAFASSRNVQKLLEPYYFDNDHNNLSRSRSRSNSFNNTSTLQPQLQVQREPLFESTRIEPGPGSTSGCVASSQSPIINRPLPRHCTSISREASNSCPTIPLLPSDGPHVPFAGQTDMNMSRTHRPIGVFWDIENCSVPRGRSALMTVQRIREKFFVDHLEAEFVCVCDIRKESPTVIQELNDAQVSVVHVAGNSKNAADDKLRQSMRRFADISCSNPLNSSWPHPATVVLISGDINFAADLYDLRYRKRLYVILLHNKQTPEALLLCAHEQYEFHTILTDLPYRSGYKDNTENNFAIPLKGGLHQVDLLVTDLPSCSNNNIKNFVRNRLRKLSENCGGKVLSVGGQWALIRFPNHVAALRASKRMNGEDVLGYKIRAICHPHQNQTIDFGSNPSTSTFQAQIMEEPMKIPHQGGYPAWKPTWRKSNLRAEGDGIARNRSQSEDQNKYNIGGCSTTAQSNSSSPNETSRDNSPNVLKPQNCDSTQVLQLNNSVHYQVPLGAQAQMNSLAGAAAGSPFAFHQNLYPNQTSAFDYSNLQQHQDQSQAPLQFQSENTMTVPRLFSVAPPPLQPSGENTSINTTAKSFPSNNFKMHSEATKSPFGIRNSILLPAPALAESPMLNRGLIPTSTPGYFAKSGSGNGESFDLTVTNIDSSIGDWKAIRGALLNMFTEHVHVRGIWVNSGSDGSFSATVRLNSKEDAHYAVAQCHRRKIGNKRIFISFDQGHSVDLECLKIEVASLLQDVPNNTLPLFKFREMFEKRYRRSISSNDLYRMRDVVQITESFSGTAMPWCGRNIKLISDWKNKQDTKRLDLYCPLHPPKVRRQSQSPRMGWAEKEAEVMLPNVVIELKDLKAKVHSLLQSHDGGFPLISFLDCFESEFGPLERAKEGNGVPLEHLISCVQGVSLVFAENGMKRVQWHEKKDIDYHATANQPLAAQLAQFGRELVDLLKTHPKCTLPFARLIPSYHTHFGRQCRVADYGHFSLSALLQTLPHVVQIMGAAQNRVLTLSHRAQMKRFATDLLRVLKSQGGPKKQIRIDDFPEAFKSVFPQREFHPEDYGLCHFSDLVAELVENTTLIAVVKDEEGNTMLAVPKREQTPQEIHKTRIFASEVVELLRHSTRCELEFSKFVPYYHHHFQKQCKVSDYGFSKLVELFDAISDTVLVLNSSPNDCSTEDKIIRLTPKEQIKVVGEQVIKIVEKRKTMGMKTLIDDLVDCFLEEHGFFLRPELCGAETMEDLVINKLENYVKVENEEVIPVDRLQIEDLAQKAESILQKSPNYQMYLEDFLSELNRNWEDDPIVDEATVEKDLGHVVLIKSKTSDDVKQVVEMSPLRIFAYEITLLLEPNEGSMPLSAVESSYLEKFGRPIRPAQLGYPTILLMLQAIPDVVSIRGKNRSKRFVVLNSAKAAFEASTSDESSASSYGKQTPRSNVGSMSIWKTSKPGSSSIPRRSSAGSAPASAKRGKGNSDWMLPANRRSVPPMPMFSPVASPNFAAHSSDPNVFSFERGSVMSPPIYDPWTGEQVGPGSPPVSPPAVWYAHPIFFPSSPSAGAAGNILMTSPFVTPAWSPAIPQGQAQPPPPQAMLGNEYLFGQNRLTTSFQGLTVDTGVEA